MRLFPPFILLCLLTACASPTVVPTPILPTQTAAPIPLSGLWMGTATKPDGTSASVILDFNTSKLQVEPMTKIWNMTIEQTETDISLVVAGENSKDPFESVRFDGSFSNFVSIEGFVNEPAIETLTGALDWDGAMSAVTFLPIATLAADGLTKYEGLYLFESGRALSIIVSPEFSSGGLTFFSKTLMMTDFDSGALRSLYPVNDTTFYIGAARVIGAPFDGRVQFMLDDMGNVTSLNWYQTPHDLFSSPEPGEFAERVPFISEDVTYTSADGIKIAGRLSIPDGDEQFPAVVMTHGSEPGTRDNFGGKLMMHFMISRGIAILNYDKRGVGDSEGRYQEAASTQNMQKLAEDVNAGVAYLLTRPEVEAKKIGVIGGSQAGWVIPLAASQSESLSFFIILSGPVTSTGVEDLFSNYTNDGETSSTYDDALITERLRKLKAGGFDPIPIIENLDLPGLWLWGSVDKSVPATLSAENLQAIIDNGKNNFSYQIFLNGDHGLTESENGYFFQIPYSKKVLFYKTLTNWLNINILSMEK